jgi:hypothetical protein
MDSNPDTAKTNKTEQPETNVTQAAAVAAAIPDLMQAVQQQGGAATMTTTTTTSNGAAIDTALNDPTPAYVPGTVLKPSSVWPPPIFLTAQASDQERFYIEHRWHAQYSWYDKRATDAKRMHTTLRLVVGIGSVIVPVLIGSNWLDLFGIVGIQQFLTITISLGVAIATAIETVYKPGDNWRSYRAAAEELAREKTMYDVKAGPYRRTKTPFLLFTERCEDIFTKQNGQWLQMQTIEEREDEKKPQIQQTVSKAQVIAPPATDINSDGSAG